MAGHTVPHSVKPVIRRRGCRKLPSASAGTGMGRGCLGSEPGGGCGPLAGIGIIPGYYVEVGLIIGCGPLGDRNRANGGHCGERSRAAICLFQKFS